MQNYNKNYELVWVQNLQDHEVYHCIRHEELFEEKCLIDVYELDRPEERLPENFLFLLKWKGALG